MKSKEVNIDDFTCTVLILNLQTDNLKVIPSKQTTCSVRQRMAQMKDDQLQKEVARSLSLITN